MNETSALPLISLGFEENSGNERYEILELICEGGMGCIYKAYDSKTDRYVAYKSIRNGADFQFELRFRYEAEVTARLEHPNIMPVYDIGTDSSGKPFYTMKLLSGRTLEKFLQDQHSVNEVMAILIKVCDAVGFAHRNNIIHRDLKPENIIIGDYGEVLILDWGIAKIKSAKNQVYENEELFTLASDLTQCGAVMGTPVYMSPEQAMDAEKADEKSDIYSIGAMLYKALIGKDPFSGKTTEEILQKVKAGKPEHAVYGTPVSALAVARQAMALKPEDRYGSVSELAVDIKKVIGGFTVNAENASLFKILGATCKRHKAVTVASIIFIIVITAVSGLNINEINSQKEVAEYNLTKAQKALNDLKKVSPVYLDRAKHSIAIGKFDEALVDVQTYLTLNNDSKEAYFLLGRINQGQMKFAEAAEAFKKAQGGSGVKKAVCVSSMQISKDAWSVCDTNGRIAPDDRLNVYMSLVNNMQLPEAAAMLDEILKDRKYAMQVFDALFKNSGLKGELQFTKSGSLQMSLDKKTTDITVLRHFSKAFFTKLILADAPITDIESLAELKIRDLDLSGTRVARLSQLKNPELQILNMAGSRFQNLEDLKGRSFKNLDLSQCPITDLSALMYINSEELNLAGCPAVHPEILLGIFPKWKKITLPSKWKKIFEEMSSESKITWSDLPAPIIQ